MKLSIVLLFALNFLGTHSHFTLTMHCHNLICRTWNQVFHVSADVPSNGCTCVLYYKCNQEDVSVGLNCINAAFNDFDPNLVCCRRPVRSTHWPHHQRPRPTKFTTQRPNPWKPAITPLQRPKPPMPGPPRTSADMPPITNSSTQTSPVTNNDCTCMPFSDCYDGDFKSTGKQESCPNPSDVCCLGWVQKLTTPQPHRPKPPQISPQPPSPGPAQPSPSIDKSCTCTPFFKCYDEETSSNLTDVVNDRSAIPNYDESCSDPNDICCYNLVKIAAKPTLNSFSEDCTGSCISIKDCPFHLNKLSEAHGGNLDAIQELRKSVCSRTDDGALNVCCPTEVEGVNNKFGVKWPDS